MMNKTTIIFWFLSFSFFGVYSQNYLEMINSDKVSRTAFCEICTLVKQGEIKPDESILQINRNKNETTADKEDGYNSNNDAPIPKMMLLIRRLFQCWHLTQKIPVAITK